MKGLHGAGRHHLQHIYTHILKHCFKHSEMHDRSWALTTWLRVMTRSRVSQHDLTAPRGNTPISSFRRQSTWRVVVSSLLPAMEKQTTLFMDHQTHLEQTFCRHLETSFITANGSDFVALYISIISKNILFARLFHNCIRHFMFWTGWRFFFSLLFQSELFCIYLHPSWLKLSYRKSTTHPNKINLIQ